MSHTISNLAAHPFQVSEFRDHLRLEITDDDPAVARSLDAAVRAVERWTGVMTRTADVVQECGYAMPPFRAEVAYPTALGMVNQINLESDVTTDITSKMALISGHGWVYAILRPRHYVERNSIYRWSYSVTPIAPFPDDLKLCIYGIGASWYENREQIQQNINLTKLPIAYRSILESYRDGML